MSRLQSLKVFISQRLSAAVEDILGHVEETILEYEQETERRHRDFLDVILTAEMKHRKAEFGSDHQQILMNTQLHPQQLEKSSNVDQDEPTGLQIKREQDEADIADLADGPVLVKTEQHEEEVQSPELHQSQAEEIIVILEDDNCEEPVNSNGYNNPELDTGSEECNVIQDQENQRNDIGSESMNAFQCSECGKRFGSLSYLKLHIRCHTGERPFRCPICKKCFTWRGRLQKHLRTHTGEKPFRCSVCGRRFSERGNLKVHMRIHTGEKPFSCTVCGKSYAQRGNLKMHVAVHKGESIYRSSLHQSEQLRRHNQAGATRNSVRGRESAANSDPQEDSKGGPTKGVNNETGKAEAHINCKESSTCEKPFSCSECGKKFGYKGQLKAHMRRHTGEKPYKCPICWKCFSWNGSFGKHMKIHTGEKPYVCSVCGKGFIEGGNLKVHMRIHTGEKPFSCPVCGRGYRQKGGLTKHLEVHQEQKRF